nr:MAG TPA: hypothetical protein [Bacteriophage sp.]
MTDRQSKQGVNALLALIESAGGMSDIDTLCTMLYLADQRLPRQIITWNYGYIQTVRTVC